MNEARKAPVVEGVSGTPWAIALAADTVTRSRAAPLTYYLAGLELVALLEEGEGNRVGLTIETEDPGLVGVWSGSQILSYAFAPLTAILDAVLPDCEILVPEPDGAQP